MKTQTIAIIGMNLVGVSMGLALKASPLEVTLIGYDASRDALEEAKSLGAVDKAEWNLISAAIQADIVILSLPADELQEALELIGNDIRPHTLVLDLSAQKQKGAQWAATFLKKGHYVGAVAVMNTASLVDGRSVNKVARADLFRQSLFCLMPTPNTEPEAVETAVNVGLLVGALPYFVDAEEYDNLVQGVELLPGLMAAAALGAVQKASGWRDMLRFAGQPFAMSTLPIQNTAETAVLAAQDKSATLRWLDAIVQELQQLRRILYDGDVDLIQSILVERNNERTRWLRTREKNDWSEEAKIKMVAAPGIAEQLMGGYLSERLRSSDEDE